MKNENQNSEEGNIIYTEKVNLTLIIKILVIIIIITGIILILIFSIINLSIHFLLVIIFFIIDSSILILYFNYRKLVINITKYEIRVKFGILNQKFIPLELIQDIEALPPKFLTFGGFGIRLGTDGSWAYLTDFKSALKIEYKNHRTFLFSTRNPEKIIEIINNLLNN